MNYLERGQIGQKYIYKAQDAVRDAIMVGKIDKEELWEALEKEAEWCADELCAIEEHKIEQAAK